MKYNHSEVIIFNNFDRDSPRPIIHSLVQEFREIENPWLIFMKKDREKDNFEFIEEERGRIPEAFFFIGISPAHNFKIHSSRSSH